MKILIVKISSMGDVIHTLPALTDAQYYFPNIKFDWVIEENLSIIPSWHTSVKKIIPIAIRRWRYNWFKKSIKKERYEFKKKLRKKKYDLIIDAQGLIKSSYMVTRIAYGFKHGLDYKSAKEPIASFFYNKKHYINKKQHAITRIRKLFSLSIGYTISNKIKQYIIKHKFNKINTKNYYFIFIHGTTNINKEWPELYWRILIKMICNLGFYIKIPWGTNLEKKRSLRLAKNFKKVIVLPYMNLTQISEQLLGATAIVSVDTGLSSLSAILSVPNITLYGPTDPNLVGRYGYLQKSFRSKDKKMSSLFPEYIFKNIKKLLNI
ncbi:lipopolysaccharide heptosyltransferase RfaC [Sodalis-like secondary symbiont of Drepanosiphum platanoidis]|uniref:lipopolysaccharide heptosyltransferase RfaC n=1 Tax=Sodalis-like secondary symbiont of Drepanosiphum platanoidis TaxID=2994493 RepID=UPI00346449F7